MHRDRSWGPNCGFGFIPIPNYITDAVAFAVVLEPIFAPAASSACAAAVLLVRIRADLLRGGVAHIYDRGLVNGVGQAGGGLIV